MPNNWYHTPNYNNVTCVRSIGCVKCGQHNVKEDTKTGKNYWDADICVYSCPDCSHTWEKNI